MRLEQETTLTNFFQNVFAELYRYLLMGHPVLRYIILTMSVFIEYFIIQILPQQCRVTTTQIY